MFCATCKKELDSDQAQVEDDSFDHAFGTERVHTVVSRCCGSLVYEGAFDPDSMDADDRRNWGLRLSESDLDINDDP